MLALPRYAKVKKPLGNKTVPKKIDCRKAKVLSHRSNNRLQATVIYTRQLHEVRETLPVSEAQCMNLVHVIFLHKENIPIFIGSCQAIAEILQKNQSFALILFDKGIHLQVCSYRESIAFFMKPYLGTRIQLEVLFAHI